ncbi:MAG: RNA polymerase sigma factor [Geminicoccaceae bacterium]
MTDRRGAAAATTEDVARASYGRLIAYLAARTGDVAAAEDALGDAFRSALETWPASGVPDRPEAWLLTTARNRLIDRHRRDRTAHDHQDQIINAAAEVAESRGGKDALPDERLKLLFICAHPAIDPGARTPLMLQTVLGLDARRIASAFLTSPSAMSQRLVRAKTKIRKAAIPFEMPPAPELSTRMQAVLEAIYAAFGTGWDDSFAGGEQGELTAEAIWLATVLTHLAPDQSEAWGLLSLMLFAQARRAARRDAEGRFVPLDRQDPGLWSASMIRDGEAALERAAAGGQAGPFQIEAAIQALHVRRVRDRQENWFLITALYDSLIALSPTLGARVSRTSALVNAGDAGGALEALDQLAAEPVDLKAYQPYWAVRAHALARLGRLEEARTAFLRAAGLTQDGAVRHFLVGLADELY